MNLVNTDKTEPICESRVVKYVLLKLPRQRYLRARKDVSIASPSNADLSWLLVIFAILPCSLADG